jgi:light-regulated signal transduction histidine kinase (bacteriophytochrome)
MAAQDADLINKKPSPDASHGAAADEQFQSSAFLIELSLDWIVQRASENIHQLLGESHVRLIDEPLSAFVQAQALHDLRNHFSRLSGSTGVSKAYRVRLTDDRPRCDIAFQHIGSRVLLEAVPSPETGLGESLGAVGGLIDGLADLGGDALLEGAARRLRALTGCDGCRITVGDRVADSNRGSFSLPDLASIGELPAIVADTSAEPVAIFPRKPSDRAPASALLKAPLPAARPALRAHGIGSLMSVPICIRGKVLGLMHCGSRSPRKVNLELHGAAELFGQMFALRLEIDKLR